MIMIEEPEMNLHRETEGILFDLFNQAVNEWDKQIVLTTHSVNLLLLAYSDIGMQGSGRGASHIKANAKKFRLETLSSDAGQINIRDYPLPHKTFKDFQADFRLMLGQS